MSTLYLVRHAQASFLADDYDQLSELGREQARQLGAHFALAGVHFDAVFVGPRRRHRQTLEALGETLPDLPVPRELPELDEYPADEVVQARLGQLSEQRPELVAALSNARDPRERGRALDHLLQHALRDWAAAADPSSARHESWQEFSARVARALELTTLGHERGRRVLVSSSAGTIGAAVGLVLRAAAEVCLELGWMLNNSSVSEIAFSAGRANLSRFNVVSHLSDPGHWTRR